MEGDGGVRADGADKIGEEEQAGYEVGVGGVEVEGIGPGGEAADGSGEIGEVGGPEGNVGQEAIGGQVGPARHVLG